jgi:SAM-dependent methyltransferase
MRSKREWKPAGDMSLIYPYLPQDTSEQCHALKEALRFMRRRNDAAGEPLKLLDLGCGRGASRMLFLEAGLNMEWRGLEIEDSPEARGGTAKDADVSTYDGIHIPCADGTFDFVYSRQVFEHVRFPRELVNEVSRVLRKDGVFVGSCSALEPFHSRSIFNFTPYGFSSLLEDAGLSGIHVRPGVDGVSLIARRLLGFVGFGSGSRMFFKESPLNLCLEVLTRTLGFETRRRAAIKLLFCGHFVFSAMKVS